MSASFARQCARFVVEKGLIATFVLPSSLLAPSQSFWCASSFTLRETSLELRSSTAPPWKTPLLRRGSPAAAVTSFSAASSVMPALSISFLLISLSRSTGR